MKYLPFLCLAAEGHSRRYGWPAETDGQSSTPSEQKKRVSRGLMALRASTSTGAGWRNRQWVGLWSPLSSRYLGSDRVHKMAQAVIKPLILKTPAGSSSTADCIQLHKHPAFARRPACLRWLCIARYRP